MARPAAAAVLCRALAACGVLLAAARAPADMHLKRQSPAPEVALKDTAGEEVSTAGLHGRLVVLVFGELYHDRTRQACDELGAALRDPRLDGQPVSPVLIVTREPRAADLKAGPGHWVPPTVLKDTDRKAFEAYRVAAMPSVVVIDKEGRVVHAVAGLTPRLGDLVVDALLLGAGKLSPEKFEQSLRGRAEPAASEQEVRAERLAQLAKQLARRGLDDMAVDKYAEALALVPRHAAAHAEVGALQLKRGRLADAEAHFRAALAERPDWAEATLGLAYVQTLRGGDELAGAERTVRAVLARAPSQARAHYLLGLIQEQQKRSDDAAASFKKAAQLLLEGGKEEAGDERH